MDLSPSCAPAMLSSKSLPSSDASRPRSGGVLNPRCTTSLTLDPSPGSESVASRKRKRDSSAMGDLLKPTILLQPHPPKLVTKPTILQPLMVIPRGHLPLSHLDLTLPKGSDLTPSRFYESRVRILDLENRRGGEPHLLIARSDRTSNLYAVEAYEKNLYTACKLGSWVDLHELSSGATIACEHLLPATRAVSGASKPKPAPPLTTPSLHKASKEKRIAIEALQSVVRKRSRTQSVSTLPPLSEGLVTPPITSTDSDQPVPITAPRTQTPDPTPSQGTQSSQPPQPEPAVLCTPPPPPSGEELLEKIRSQYFEALYRSKGSLAYFPKGPLSRARAAFHLESDVSLNMADLVSFLRDLIIPLRHMNKKYQETIPNIIKEMKTRVYSSGEEKRRKRKAKKMKIGRNGLYPGEDESVRKWWIANKPEPKDGEAGMPDYHVKSYVALLRSRETQLQIILALEILALEPLAAAAGTADAQLPGLQPSIEAEQPKKTTTKEQDLPDLVDMHADLLCIWQSTASDDIRLLEDSEGADHAMEGQNGQKASSEPLKDFCVDIVIPFFSARLPELCSSLNKKLGGPPILKSPPKQRQAKPSAAPTKPPRPGTTSTRTVPTKQPKSLQHALVSDRAQRDRRSMSRGPSRAVAALLSATETAIPGLKRENSDSQSLMSIPRMKSDVGLLRGGSRSRAGSLSRSNSVSVSGADDPRQKKKAQVEAELQDAIAALRKPNRQLAGKSTAEEAEQRVSKSLSQMRKTKKPTRMSPSTDRVQVKATPMHNRFRDSTRGESQPSAIAFSFSRAAQEPPPSSGVSVIPSTAPRNGFRDALFNGTSPLEVIGSTPAQPAAVDVIEATPMQPGGVAATPIRVSMRPPAAVGAVEATPAPLAGVAATPIRDSMRPGASHEEDFGMVPQSSPLVFKKPASFGRHLGVPKAVPTSSGTGGMRSLKDIFKTPVKSKPGAPLMDADANKAEDAGLETKKMSVYERLGWDNEYDDL